MATKYYAVLTNVGAAKLAKATALGAQVEITQMAVGDGNGALPTPNPAQTALVHELRRAPLNTLSIDQNNANQIIAEQVIPEEVGGWWIREIGLFDEDGDMIAVANCAETYKPQLQEGSGRVQIVRMILIVSSTAAVTLKIDPSVVLATRAYVDSQIISAKSYADDLMGTHLASENPHDQYPLISNALKEMADAGLVDEVLKNLGLGDATKAVIHTGKIIEDLNAPPKNSTGFAYSDAQNSPGFSATVLTVDSIIGSYDIQIAIGYNPLKFAFRAYSGDSHVWLNWIVLGDAAAKNTGTTAGTVAAGDDSRITGAIQRTAMVGAVSQTGGAPAGAIIERGSNSNGEYIKFADGTLICWFTRTVESITSNPSGGTTNLYFSSEVGLTFPATFVGTTPTVTPSASLSSGGTSSWPSVRGRSLTGTSLALISNVQNAAAYLGYTAIGRWF